MINPKLLQSVFECVYTHIIYIIYIDGTVRDRVVYDIITKTLLCVRDIHTDLGHISRRRRRRGSGDDDYDDEMRRSYQHAADIEKQKNKNPYFSTCFEYAPSAFMTHSYNNYNNMCLCKILFFFFFRARVLFARVG